MVSTSQGVLCELSLIWLVDAVAYHCGPKWFFVTGALVTEVVPWVIVGDGRASLSDTGPCQSESKHEKFGDATPFLVGQMQRSTNAIQPDDG